MFRVMTQGRRRWNRTVRIMRDELVREPNAGTLRNRAAYSASAAEETMATILTPVSKIDDDEVRQRLPEIPGWGFENGKLHREFSFSDFVEAFSFMTRVALLAETRSHHPDWSNVYNRVVIDLNTHDVGGVSERDFDLAAEITKALSE
jgi:4a-hydroxytetrahydrobiopterin dehydratase